MNGKIFLVFLSLSLGIWAQQTVTIKGYAPAYVGKSIRFNQIEDYLSMVESTLGTATVQADSTFSATFFLEETQKIMIHAENNKTSMYVAPGSQYIIGIPEKDARDPYNPSGNRIEVTFFDLDSTDVNYKILQYNRWQDKVMGAIFYKKKSDPVGYAKAMDDFRTAVQNYYVRDTGTYVYDYIRFSIAELDNISSATQRNRMETYDFHLKPFTVLYRNDRYMSYFNSFYDGMMLNIHNEVNNQLYLGVLKSSPTMVMKALGRDYTMKNLRARELVMIKLLAEEFYKDDLPQTNIEKILDSLSEHALFDQHKLIAKNMKRRLTELVSGSKAPNFLLKDANGQAFSLTDFQEKHLYIHFFDPSSKKNWMEAEALKPIYERYSKHVNFITLMKPDAQHLDELDVPWKVFTPEINHPIWEKYQVATFPNYILLDGYGYVVANPALGPMPNAQYQTIDYIFYLIAKEKERMQGGR